MRSSNLTIKIKSSATRAFNKSRILNSMASVVYYNINLQKWAKRVPKVIIEAWWMKWRPAVLTRIVNIPAAQFRRSQAKMNSTFHQILTNRITTQAAKCFTTAETLHYSKRNYLFKTSSFSKLSGAVLSVKYILRARRIVAQFSP